MIEKIELEIVEREISDLIETVHLLELGFEAEYDETGCGCMNVIKKRLEYMLIEFKESVKIKEAALGLSDEDVEDNEEEEL